MWAWSFFFVEVRLLMKYITEIEFKSSSSDVWPVNQLTKNVFVLELEHLQEEYQRREAEEKENRQVEIQRSTVRSRRGKRQPKLGESQPEQKFQEGAKVSLNWTISYCSMLVETLICPLNIFFMSTEKRWRRRDSCVTSDVQHARQEECSYNREEEEELSGGGVCV